MTNQKHKKTRRNLEEIKQQLHPTALFVREHRKYLGYTQVDFAKRVGVNLRFLQELELGKPTLRMDKVNQVLDYLGARLEPVKWKESDEK